MDIHEFITRSALELAAFKAAYLEAAQIDSTFASDRSETDWWREVAAYMMYVEAEEQFQKE